MSQYVVLRQVEPDEAAALTADPEAFEILSASIDATSRRAAIKAATADLLTEQKNGTFVAVLASEWKPETPKVQVTETYNWE